MSISLSLSLTHVSSYLATPPQAEVKVEVSSLKGARCLPLLLLLLPLLLVPGAHRIQSPPLHTHHTAHAQDSRMTNKKIDFPRTEEETQRARASCNGFSPTIASRLPPAWSVGRLAGWLWPDTEATSNSSSTPFPLGP